MGDDISRVDVNECTNGSAKCGKMQDASTQEVIAKVSVFRDIKVTVSHAERKMHVPTEVITVTLKPIVLAQRITKGKISTTCICEEGFDGNGKKCVGLDESAKKCDGNTDCVNTVGSLKCKCKQGFNDDGIHCTDIDECTSIPVIQMSHARMKMVPVFV